MKKFTDEDAQVYAGGRAIMAGNEDLIERPLQWQKDGLQQTASGYGAKLNSGYMVHFNGRLYRVYIVQWGNAGSAYFIAKGERIGIL